jgi:hypothetical protein
MSSSNDGSYSPRNVIMIDQEDTAELAHKMANLPVELKSDEVPYTKPLKRHRSLQMGLSDEDDEEPNVKKQKRVRETPSVTFDHLPIDILGVIFKYFNILELFRLQLVAKRWQNWCWRFQTLLDFRLINKELTDKHLEPILSKVQNLLRVNFYDCPSISSHALVVLAKYATNLQSLNINKCANLQIEGLQALTHISTLRRLVLSHKITDDIRCFTNLHTLLLTAQGEEQSMHPGLSLISTLTKLQDLQLDGCGNVSVDDFKPLTQLQWLRIRGTNLADTDLQDLTHLVNVRQLNISDNQKIANGEYLGHLTSLTNLQTLYLEDVSFSPKFVCQLSGLSSLRQLSISLLWNDQNVGYFTCFDNLRSLGLDYSYCHEINIEDFSRVTFFTKLKNLKLEANGVEQQINMERLKCLEPMTWLEELNFIAEECVVDFKQLSKYTNLRRLLFNNSLKPNEK